MKRLLEALPACFEKRFRQEDAFLADHRVLGRAVVPAAYLIEMVAAAVQELAGEEAAPFTLSSLRIERPLLVTEPRIGELVIERALDGTVRVEISSAKEAEADEPSAWQRHLSASLLLGAAQGTARLGPETKGSSGAALYARLSKLGLEYGPHYRVIEQLEVAAGQGQARLVASGAQPFFLNPALVDGALQALAALVPDDGIMRLPAEIAEVRVHRRLGGVAQAVFGLEQGLGQATLFDAEGNAAVELIGIQAKALAPEVPARAETKDWLKTPRLIPVPEPGAAPSGRWLVVGDDLGAGPALGRAGLVVERSSAEVEHVLARIDAEPPVDALLWIAPKELSLEAELNRLLLLSRGLKARLKGRALKLSFVTRGAYDGRPEQRAMGAFLKSVAREDRRFSLRIIDLALALGDQASARLARELGGTEEEIRLGAERLIPAPGAMGGGASPVLLEAGMTAVVTGGAGGVGGALASGLLRLGLRVVSIGRASRAHSGVETEVADVTDRSALEAALTRIRQRHGPIHLVVHAAGALRDSSIDAKSEADIAAVVRPKVQGALNLAALTAQDPLRAMVLISSLSGRLGNVGQADYAAANAYLDALASARSSAARPWISLAYGPWRDTGMMKGGAEHHRIESVDPELGTALFFAALAAPAPEILAAKEKVSAPRANAAPAEGIDRYLIRTMAATLGIPEAEVNPKQNFMELGFDSLSAVKVRKQIERDAGVALDATLLFEFPSVLELGRHLSAAHGEAFAKMLGGPAPASPPPPAEPKAPALAASPQLPAPPPLPENAPALTASPGLPPPPTDALFAEPVPALTRAPLPHPLPISSTEAVFDPAPRAVLPPSPRGVAIVGVSCRFPGAPDLESYWNLLASGQDAIREVPQSRYRWAEARDAGRSGKPRFGGFLADIEHFDPAFFGLSGSEAAQMDPQQRLLLEVAHEAVERAATTPEALAAIRTGVFIGAGGAEYPKILERAGRAHEAHTGSGNALSMLANRISYLFDWTGPSMTVDTACSASLVALHLAVSAMEAGEIDAALVGGASLILTPDATIIFGEAGMLAKDGRSKSFDARADGYVRGEGIAAILLKPLALALADGDPILAVIEGTAVNHDGHSKAGLTAPNPKAQRRAIEEAWAKAGIEPRQIGLIEAHGTGTSLGDPIEIRGLVEAFRTRTAERGFCAIGSVKTNIGHLEPCAGLAGLIKLSLALRHGLLPPTLHFLEPNPHLTLEDTPFFVNDRLRTWPCEPGALRRGGVSSFGFGGANAHAVLREPPAPLITETRATAELITFSAASETALAKELDDHQRLLAEPGVLEELAIEDLARSRNLGRRHYGQRAALIARVPEQVRDKLEILRSALPVERQLRQHIYTSASVTLDQTLARLLTLSAEAAARLMEAGRGPRFAEEILPRLQGRPSPGGEPSQRPSRVDASSHLVGGPKGATASLVGSKIGRREGERHEALEVAAQLYVLGFDLDLASLSSPRGRKVDLPTTPFDRVRCWRDPAAPAAPSPTLHPLIPEVRPDLDGMSWTARLSARDPIFSDHRVNGRAVLPAAAILELARFAAAAALGARTLRLHQIELLSFVAAGQQEIVELVLRVHRTRTSDLAFHLESRGPSGERVEHARALIASAAPAAAPAELSPLPGDAPKVLGPALYQALEARGLHYGPRFQSVAEVRKSGDRFDADLQRPSPGWAAMDIDPALLDGAFQAAGVLFAEGAGLRVPVGAQEVLCYAPLPDAPRVLGRQGSAGLDLTLLDPQSGRVAVALYGLRLEALAAPRAPQRPFLPVFQASPALPAPSHAERLVLVGAHDRRLEALRAALEARGVLAVVVGDEIEAIAAQSHPGATVVVLDERGPATRSLLPLAQRLARHDLRIGALRLVTTTNPEAAAGAALLATLGAELGGLERQWIEIDEATSPTALAAELTSGISDLEVSLAGGERRVRRLTPGSRAAVPLTALPGLSLVTGGLGGVGRHLLPWILERGGPVAVISRQRIDAAQAAALGPRVLALAADVTEPGALRAALEAARARFGRIHRVFHAAAITKDGLLRAKSAEDFARVLAPKVQGAQLLDRLTEVDGDPQMLLFSSIVSLSGNLGQADYAVANRFLDAFAVERSKRGRPTVSIAFGMWDETGLGKGLGEVARARGIAPLSPADALDGLAQAMLCGQPLVVVAPVDRPDRAFSAAPRAPQGGPAPDLAARGERATEEQVRDKLISVLAKVLETDESKVDADQSFLDMGMDSILAVRAVTRIQEGTKANFSPTLLFDYPSVRALAKHLASDPRAQAWATGAAIAAEPAAEAPAAEPQAAAMPSAEDPFLPALPAGPGLTGVPMLDRTGLRVVSQSPRSLTTALPNSPDNQNHLGTIYAGALFTFAEGTSVMGLSHVFADQEIVPVVLGSRVEYQSFGISELSCRFSISEADYLAVRGALSQHGEAKHTVRVTLEGATGERVASFSFDTLLRQRRHKAPRIEPVSSAPKATPITLRDDDIAIIGLAGRFPKARAIPEYWENLRQGRNCISEVTPDRWSIERYFDPNPEAPGKTYTRWGGFLEDIHTFDPLFFGISPREAEQMDPQQRKILEVSWEALESAGYGSSSRRRAETGVFLGISSAEYASTRVSNMEEVTAHLGLGNALSIAANRISYQLDLKGPSLVVDTACSSSLVALHLAVQNIRAGACRMALAGGVHAILAPEGFIFFSKGRFMSPEGQCKTFDARADGYVRGEGAGLVLLKRWDEAVKDGDPIRAVIRGVAVNQDGRSNGLTAPNGRAQVAVLNEAYQRAGVEPRTISLIEAHGTGTDLGDPIEVSALTEVFQKSGARPGQTAIGSVKTSIGHLEPAAGAAALIKTVLALEHQELPPTRNFVSPNPHIRFEDTPFYVNDRLRPWRPIDGVRRAGISGFGFGGANAHVVLEEAPARTRAERSEPAASHVLMLSARTEEALAKTAAAWRDALAHSPEDPADVAYTAELGRARFDHRLAVAGEETADLAARLQDFLDGKRRGRLAVGRVKGGKRRKLAFLFTGQGAQAPGMGKVLYDHEPVFRQTIDRCASAAAEVLDVPLLELLYGKASAQIQETRFAQPALFAVELALVELLRSRGVEPDALLGHSVGEYVAATVAGVMRPEEGMALIAARGRAMQALPGGGAMAALFEAEAQVLARLRGREQAVSIAAVNAPAAVVISGDGAVVATIVKEAEDAGVTTAPLIVSHAFHSPRMDPMLEAWERRAGAIRYGVPKIPVVSNLDGRLYSPEVPVDGAYWAKHVRAAVRFADGLETLIQAGITGFLEIGPHAVLTALAERARTKHSDLLLVSTLARGRDDRAALADARAKLFAAGIEERPSSAVRQTLALPTYPFEERSCWLPLADREAQRTAAQQTPPPTLSPKPDAPALPGGGFVDTID